MTSLIQARLLGAPVIKKDGKEIFFPYNKVNALVYYLLVKGTVMRDELSGVLWADKPDAIARKNLRNAIYETKKILTGITESHSSPESHHQGESGHPDGGGCPGL